MVNGQGYLIDWELARVGDKGPRSSERTVG